MIQYIRLFLRLLLICLVVLVVYLELFSPASAPRGIATEKRVTYTPAYQAELSMYQDMLDNHYEKIFPNGNRNAGGPMFFKYIYENLATSFEDFERYNRFYCGVSGSIIDPRRHDRHNTVKIRDANNQCVLGNYYNCCWPCSGDIMKYARVETVDIQLPKSASNAVKRYRVLTINDPCQPCNTDACPPFPIEVGAFQCAKGLTQNGLRVRDGALTTAEGRLIFALFYEPNPHDTFETSILKMSAERHTASVSELQKMGGMGDIFVKLSQVAGEDTYQLCQ